MWVTFTNEDGGAVRVRPEHVVAVNERGDESSILVGGRWMYVQEPAATVQAMLLAYTKAA